VSLRRCVLVSVLALGAFVSLGGVSAAHEPRLEVVASGLDNPRGLAFGHSGALYVAEAGRGGDGPCIELAEGPQCAGTTGAITRISHGAQRRVITGLPSLASPEDGSGASGPHDIALDGWGAYVPVGLGGDPALREQLGRLGPRFGQLYRVSPFFGVRAVADLAAFEAAEDPSGSEPNSNPNSVATFHSKRYVVDAGGNDLLRVGRNGKIRTLAVFPQRLVPAPPGFPVPEVMMDAVPTGVVVGPDRALYVSQLTGFPFPAGGANIYRVERGGGEPEVYASGFSAVTDLAFGPDGSLYVLEFAANGFMAGPPGALIRVRPNGSRETIASEGLVTPTGVAVSRNGKIYVSNFGAAAGVGEVVRVIPGD
jgi:hypothetical protein